MGEIMKKKDEGLAEEILQIAQNLLNSQGIEKITIRAIAQKAGIATGTVYNYFSNKEEILFQITRSYWEKAFVEMERELFQEDFYQGLKASYALLQNKMKEPAGQVMKKLGNLEKMGIVQMGAMEKQLSHMMVKALEKDHKVKKEVWNESFTKEAFGHFLVMHMVASLRYAEESIDFLGEVVQRILYEKTGG